MYINDLCDNLSCDVKPFADDTSVFSAVENEVAGAVIINRELDTMRFWAWQFKMEFNVDKTEEVVFSSKRKSLSTHHCQWIILKLFVQMNISILA